MVDPLQAKFDALQAGEPFTFLYDIGAPDVEAAVGMVAMKRFEDQGVCYLFEVTRTHGSNGPHETVFRGKQEWEGN